MITLINEWQLTRENVEDYGDYDKASFAVFVDFKMLSYLHWREPERISYHESARRSQ